MCDTNTAINANVVNVSLTAAQNKWLRQANNLGQIAWNGPRGYGRSVYERVMNTLTAKGLVTPNAFGEYELTCAGRSALSSQGRETAGTAPVGGAR